MKTVIILCVIVFLFNFMTIVGHDNPDERLLNRYTETVTKEIVPRGASQIKMNNVQELLHEKELGNIPLRKQVGPSCATVSLAMHMDYLGQEYRSQEFYDECANRYSDSGTSLQQIIGCASSLGIKIEHKQHYKIDQLKTGDLVILYQVGSITTHMVVIDSVNKNTIRIADPNGYYTTHTVDEFELIYTRHALVSTTTT